MFRPFAYSIARRTALAALVAGVAAVAAPATAGAPGPETTRAAAPAPVCDRVGGASKCMVVLIDHLKRLPLPGDVATLLIGNPAIADVNLISGDQAVINARSIGTTNMLFLDETGDEVAHYQVIVREPEARRVTLRRGPNNTSLFQCAPRCERTLTQNDSPGAYGALVGVLQSENSINDAALGGPGDVVIPDGSEPEFELQPEPSVDADGEEVAYDNAQ